MFTGRWMDCTWAMCRCGKGGSPHHQALGSSRAERQRAGPINSVFERHNTVLYEAEIELSARAPASTPMRLQLVSGPLWLLRQ
jgi:hypothetical protein